MQKNRGFTLIELIVTLAILAIVATLAVPSMVEIIHDLQLEEETQDLQSFLIDTRVTAITTRTNQRFAVKPNIAGVTNTWEAKRTTAEITGQSRLQFSSLGVLMTVEQAEVPANGSNPKIEATAALQTQACITVQHNQSLEFKHIEITRLGMIGVIQNGACA